MIADSEVEYTAKISPSITQITGDKTKIQEVFTNLLKNAYEASAPNGSIYLHAFEENDKKIVEICIFCFPLLVCYGKLREMYLPKCPVWG